MLLLRRRLPLISAVILEDERRRSYSPQLRKISLTDMMNAKVNISATTHTNPALIYSKRDHSNELKKRCNSAFHRLFSSLVGSSLPPFSLLSAYPSAPESREQQQLRAFQSHDPTYHDRHPE